MRHLREELVDTVISVIESLTDEGLDASEWEAIYERHLDGLTTHEDRRAAERELAGE